MSETCTKNTSKDVLNQEIIGAGLCKTAGIQASMNLVMGERTIFSESL